MSSKTSETSATPRKWRRPSGRLVAILLAAAVAGLVLGPVLGELGIQIWVWSTT
jgi:hypothetical protein